MKAISLKAGWTTSAIASGVYRFNYGVLATPAISPPSGTYIYGQSIALSGDPIATIYYTVDGSLPSVESSAYTGPVTLTGPMALRAIAFHRDWTTSQLSVATFAAKVATPTFTPDAGTYSADQHITIATATPAATIHYTNNGLDPTVHDPILESGGSLPVGNYTLKARAFRTGLLTSDLKTAAYMRDGDPCRYTLTPSVISVGPTPTGGLITLAATNSGCSWSAIDDQSWIDVEPSSGTGTVGEVVYHVAANQTSTLRTGLITIAGQNLLVVQGGQGSCSYSLTPGAIAATADATTGQVIVSAADAACSWTAAVDVPWTTVSTSTATSAYAQAIVADHPIGYWRLNEPAGATSALDASGFGRNGFASAGVSFGATGPLADGSGAAAFDGATGVVQIAHDSGFNRASLSWEAWVRMPATSSAWRRILGKGEANTVFSLAIAPNSSQATIAFGLTAAGAQTITLNAPVVGANWMHLAFTYDGTTWRAYANGVEDTSGTTVDALVTNTDSLILGRGETADAWYDGTLADVAVYPYALSAAQVAHHVAQRTATATGGGQLAYAIAENTTGAWRTGSLNVAGILVPVSQAGSDGVAIAASVSPSPNAVGWNNTDVTVAFVCAGSGALTCPDPVSVSQDGERDIDGQVSDTTGHTATTTVHVKLDKTAPFVAITAPSRGAVVDAGPVVVTGTAIDALSETTLTCAGAAATLENGTFTCTVIVPPGISTMTVEGTDAAGNVRSVAVAVTTIEQVVSSPPTSLRMTPQQVIMLAGETRRFSAVDNLNRIPSNATWAINHPDIATLNTTPDVTLTGLMAGDVMLTASWQGLTATTQITVLAATAELPIGTTLWAAPPAAGSVTFDRAGGCRA